MHVSGMYKGVIFKLNTVSSTLQIVSDRIALHMVYSFFKDIQLEDYVYA